MRQINGNSNSNRFVVMGAMALMLGLAASAQILPIKPPALPKPAAKPAPAPKPAPKPPAPAPKQVVLPPRPAVTPTAPATVPPRAPLTPTQVNTPVRPNNGRVPLNQLTPNGNGTTAQPNGNGRPSLSSLTGQGTGANGRPSLSSLGGQGTSGSPASNVAGNQGAQQAGGAAGNGAAGGNRAQVGADGGLGTFPGAYNYSLTPYSCFRSGAQVLCDFDLSNQNNIKANSKIVYSDTHLVNSAGRTINRSDAYFVDSDGTKFTESQITPGSKVRMVMVFDNVPAATSSVTMAQGSATIPNVAISSQESGAASQGAPAGDQPGPGKKSPK